MSIGGRCPGPGPQGPPGPPSPVAFGGVPAQIDIGDAGFAGVSGLASRSDHEHPFPAPAAAPPAISSAGATGVATTPARSDHAHEGVHSISESGEAQLTGDVTLSEGSGITLVQVGNDIQINATGPAVNKNQISLSDARQVAQVGATEIVAYEWNVSGDDVPAMPTSVLPFLSIIASRIGGAEAAFAVSRVEWYQVLAAAFAAVGVERVANK